MHDGTGDLLLSVAIAEERAERLRNRIEVFQGHLQPEERKQVAAMRLSLAAEYDRLAKHNRRLAASADPVDGTAR